MWNNKLIKFDYYHSTTIINNLMCWYHDIAGS